MYLLFLKESARVALEIASAFNNPAMMKGLAMLGGPLAVLSIAMMFLPKQPSAEEKAIKEALETITKKMDVLHMAQMKSMS